MDISSNYVVFKIRDMQIIEELKTDEFNDLQLKIIIEAYRETSNYMIEFISNFC